MTTGVSGKIWSGAKRHTLAEQHRVAGTVLNLHERRAAFRRMAVLKGGRGNLGVDGIRRAAVGNAVVCCAGEPAGIARGRVQKQPVFQRGIFRAREYLHRLRSHVKRDAVGLLIRVGLLDVRQEQKM